jgi:Leucine-rich repeat (LRR) protein
MQEMKNTRSRIIQQAIASLDPEHIDQAISELMASGDLDAWEELLQDTIIDHKGRLHASAAMVLPAPHQRAADHALLELIGRAPEEAVLNPTLQRNKIKKLQFRNIDRDGLPLHAFTHFPEGIYRLHALEEFDVHSVPNGDLPDGISALPALRRLRLANVGISRLPADISQCQQLEFLDLSLNGLSHLPKHLTEIRSLRELHLDGNHLEDLPADLQALDRLEVIRLPENVFTEIPEVLTQMPSLKKIILSYNRLKGEIPCGMADLPALELLDIAGNRHLKLTAKVNNLRSGCLTVHVHRRSGEQPVSDGENPADEAPDERIRTWVENIDGYFSTKDNRQGRAAIELIRTINDTELFRYLLRHWSIRDGALVCDAPNHDRKAGAYIHSSEYVTDLLFHNDNDYLTSAFDLSQLTKLSLGFKSMRFHGITELMPNIEELTISLLDQYVPKFLSSFRQIRKLRVLGTDKIKSLNIDGWPQLEDIDYMGGSCQQFTIQNRPTLTKLEVRGSDFPEIILANNPRLEKLSLNSERVNAVSIEACAGLRSFTLGGHGDVKRFQIEEISQLESLSIDRPVNLDLISRLFEAPHLREITFGMSWNHGRPPLQIQTLPRPKSPHIRSFTVTDIGIHTIPDWLLSLDQLEVLELSDNLIEQLPRDWTGLRSLQQLKLEHNQIGEIPEDIQLPTSLRELHLGQNKLHSIPAILAELPALQYLQLDTQSSMVPKNSSLQKIPPALSGKRGLEIRIDMDEMEKRKMIIEGLAWQLHQYGILVNERNA